MTIATFALYIAAVVCLLVILDSIAAAIGRAWDWLVEGLAKDMSWSDE